MKAATYTLCVIALLLVLEPIAMPAMIQGRQPGKPRFEKIEAPAESAT